MVSQLFPGCKLCYLQGVVSLRIIEYCTSITNSYFLIPQSVYMKAFGITYSPSNKWSNGLLKSLSLMQ